MKTVLGVILLRTAWRYHDSMKDHEKDDQEESKHGHGLDVDAEHPHLLRKQSLTTDIRKRPTKDSDKGPFKSKSLSDIERFTLCSNRIV